MSGLIEIDDKGLDEAREAIKKLKKWPQVAEKVIARHLKFIVKESKTQAPVDTGALRDSIKSLGVRISNDVITGTIEAGVDYASFVEKRVGFMSDAIEGDIDELVKDLQEAFEKLMR